MTEDNINLLIGCITILIALFIVAHFVLPMGQTIDKHEILRAEKECDGEVLKYNTYLMNSATCENGDMVFFDTNGAAND